MMNNELQDLVLDVREQVRYLRELGVDALEVTLSERADASPSPNVVSAAPLRPAAAAIPEIVVPVSKPAEPRVPGQSRLASLPTLSKRTAQTPQPIVQTVAQPEKQELRPQTEMPITVTKPTQPASAETIELIRAEIGIDCTRCKLSTLGRSKVVNSTGNFNAELMFVGEAPGADEDEQGKPFVGRAGQLLTDIIEKGLQIKREDVFIGNINRCRPPANRAPEPDETIACKPFLLREIAVVRPKVIVVLGATAAHNLLETKVPIGKLRGHIHDYQGCKVMPTFHPAYLLRDPHKKREVWEDMKMVRDYLASQ